MPSAKHYHKKRNGKQAYMNSLINHAVYQMLFNEKPNLIVKEDLNFTKEKLPKIKNKWVAKQRRNLASWAKGKLNDRIEYLCQKYRIPFGEIRQWILILLIHPNIARFVAVSLLKGQVNIMK